MYLHALLFNKFPVGVSLLCHQKKEMSIVGNSHTTMDEDANFCFQVDFPTILVTLEEIIDVDPNSKWSGLLAF